MPGDCPLGILMTIVQLLLALIVAPATLNGPLNPTGLQVPEPREMPVRPFSIPANVTVLRGTVFADGLVIVTVSVVD